MAERDLCFSERSSHPGFSPLSGEVHNDVKTNKNWRFLFGCFDLDVF
jgi:hypothetical protein